MKPSNSKIPTLQVPAAAEKASQSTSIRLTRPIKGIRIPDGHVEMLPAGAEAYLTQALGASFTISVQHQLYRIDGDCGDAIQQPPRPSLDPALLQQPINEDTIKAVLKTCFDPEIPVNLWDLGLIYKITIKSNQVSIEMTLTNPGCGMGEVLIQDIKQKLDKLDAVESANIKLVFDPPWSRERISTAGQLALGLL